MDGSQRLEASRDTTGACLRCYCTHAIVTHAVHETQPCCLIRGMQHLLREPQESESPHHWELTLWEAAAYSWPVQQDMQRCWLEQQRICCPAVRHSIFGGSLKCSNRERCQVHGSAVIQLTLSFTSKASTYGSVAQQHYLSRSDGLCKAFCRMPKDGGLT